MDSYPNKFKATKRPPGQQKQHDMQKQKQAPSKVSKQQPAKSKAPQQQQQQQQAPTGAEVPSRHSKRSEQQPQQQHNHFKQQHQHQHQHHQQQQSSPQIVENTLKDFFKYLKSIQERLQNLEGNTNSNALLLFEPWTEMDTKSYCIQLETFQTTLVEQIDRFPLHSNAGREILLAIQNAVSKQQGILRNHNNNNNNNKQAKQKGGKGPHSSCSVTVVLGHVRQMVQHISSLLQEIQLVDLDTLIHLMKNNQKAGDVMEGQDVVLLCGAARSGKTTTLHFLAGTTFEEVEVDGFFHLQPASFADPQVAPYETGCCERDPVTRHLQTAEVTIINTGKGGAPKKVVLCDTPGLGHDSFTTSDTGGGVELDIANGLGMIRAIHKAKTVKPVLIISQEEVRVRERFSAFDGETVATVSKLLSKNSHQDCLSPFNYAFTKYEAKHKDCLCRQFSSMRKNLNTSGGSVSSSVSSPTNSSSNSNNNNNAANNSNMIRDQRMLKRLLDDITQKTTPEANIILPFEEDSEVFLNKIWEESLTVNDPKKYFIPFVSYSALKKLQLQLRITLSDLRTSLVEEDQNTAVYRLRQLNALAEVLPEASDCARLGMEAVKKHVTGLRSRVLASIDRQDYSMAMYRSQQLITLSEVVPEAETYGKITHDAVVMLRDLVQALQQSTSNAANTNMTHNNSSSHYKTCQDRMSKLSELAREFPEANKCAHLALKASVQHVADFRERIIKFMDSLLMEKQKDMKRFTAQLERLRTEMAHVVASEPLLLLCVKERDFVDAESNKQEELVLKKLSQCSSEAFCIDQVQRLTDHLMRDIPNFASGNFDMDELLKKKDVFLSSLERLKIVSVRLQKSPAGARAESVYHQAFHNFHDLVSGILANAEEKYKSTWTDLEDFGRQVWCVSSLLQGPLKNKPYTARREHSKIDDLERRLLKLMLRLEIEVSRSMERLKTYKFPDCHRVSVKPTPIPELKIHEMKAPRFLLISVAKNGRIRKLLPSKLDVLEINVCIAMFDHALLDFWRKAVIRLEQDYSVIVAMQKVHKDPQEILQLAKIIRGDIARVEKEFLGVCGWSDDITSESEADLKRLIAVRDCVQVGVGKLEELVATRSSGASLRLFQCGGLSDVSGDYLCKPRAAPE